MKSSKVLFTSASLLFIIVFAGCKKNDLEDFTSVSLPEDTIAFTMPNEEAKHEGTWLQWPHEYTYGPQVPAKYDQIWVEMTKALHTGEVVHIVAYNEIEKDRITKLLENVNVDMNQIDFLIKKTEDVWVRDNGPIFVHDANNNLSITNWKFNGWGGKADYINDNQIPSHVSEAINIPKVDVDMVLEGGAIEVDGRGTLMTTRSSVLNKNRNPNLTQAQAEAFFKHYLGVTNFIWLDGIVGQDITDHHIDGFARFVQGNILLTHAKEYMTSPNEYEVLSTAKNASGELYKRIELPIASGNSDGSYMNYYVGNEVVLVPNYGETTDFEANTIIQGLYPSRKVVGIVVTELWKNGGAIHCVTQQQPE